MAYLTDEERENSHATERRALTVSYSPGAYEAILALIDALRHYRAAVTRLVEVRYSDGEVDGATLTGIINECVEAERGLGESKSG